MSYRHFGDYVADFSRYDDRFALIIRRFIKIDRLRYRELQQLAYQVSRYLQSMGVKPGERIMVVAGNAPEWLELFLGAQLIGAILVPVDAASSLETTLRFINQTQPVMLFRSSYLHPELGKHVTTLVLDELPQSIRSYSTREPEYQLQGDEVALIVFTSGTTADPKGVVLTQKNLLTNIMGIQQRIDIKADWRLLSVLPLSHMYELTGSLAILSRGASIHYLPRVTPLAIAKALQDYQITTILAIPQLLILLFERIEQTAAEEGRAVLLHRMLQIAHWLPFSTRRLLFSSVHSRLGGHLELIVTGGAPIPFTVATAWENMGVKMVQGYGLTETSPILAVNGLKDRHLDSPGRPLDNVKLRIAEDGEIQARGPNVFKQYWHNRTASEDAFTKDGWFRTGDIGNLRQGWLHIQGRLKFAIVLSSGLKVFPEDIESVATKHPAFDELCVVGINENSGEAVLAVVISDRSDKAVDDAIAEINARLESFQHISAWRRWPEGDFPRTRLLKVDRRKVQQWANTTERQEAGDSNPEEKNQDRLLTVIRLSLGQEKVQIKDTDRLADIGLDSLRRLTLIAAIEEQIGIAIAEENVTPTTTVASLRKSLDHGKPAKSAPRIPSWPLQKLVRLLGNGLRETVIRLAIRMWVKIDTEGQEQLDHLVRPAIFIFNHSDDFDGPVIYQAIPRRIRKRLAVAAADDVLQEHKLLAFIIRLCFAGFNLSRQEPYLPSLEYVATVIDQGWNVVLSPEGRISTSGKLQPFKSGVGLLAVELGVPVVPIKTFGLHGTVPLHAKWPKKHSRVTVRIGQPVSFGPDEDYDEVAKKLYDIMRDL